MLFIKKLVYEKMHNFFYTCGKFKRNDRLKQNAKFLVKTFFGKKRKIFETIFFFAGNPITGQ